MRMPSRKCLLGAAVLAVLGAGVAQAATVKLHTMNVNAPDGSIVQVRYAGDVAPRVEIVPVEAITSAAVPAMGDPFAAMERVSAMMDAHMHAMMQRAAVLQQQAIQMQQRAVETGEGQVMPGFTVVGDVPNGMHVTYYSSTTDANGCTRSVSYASDGSGAAPRMTQAASDGCDAAKPNGAAIPAKVEKPAAAPAAPGQKV